MAHNCLYGVSDYSNEVGEISVTKVVMSSTGGGQIHSDLLPVK